MKFWYEYITKVCKIRSTNREQAIMDQEIKMATDTLKDPSSVPLITYLWVFLLSLFGCIVRVLRELQTSRKSLRQIIVTFIVELLTSGFAGLVTFFLCEAMDVNPMYAAVWISIAGWMGVRALTVLESLHKARFGAKE